MKTNQIFLKGVTMKKFSIAVIGILVLLVSGSCFGYSDEGVQWWTAATASFDVAEDWSGKLSQEFRLGDDGGNLYYEHTDLAFTYTGLTEGIDAGVGFRLIYEKNSSDDYKRENRPHFNVTFKGKLFDWSVSDRNMFEYRDKDNKEDVWRYRNKVTIKFPVELTALKIKPYIADEIFLTMNDDKVDRNRLYFGGSVGITENLSADLFYMWQSSNSGGKWLDLDVLGTYLKFKF